jgi:ATP-dependent protease ClpP protease subunit
MKRISILLATLVLFLPLLVMADESKKEPPVGRCPKTLVVGKVADCMTCHVAPTFKLKEADPHAVYNYPNVFLKFLFDKDGKPFKAYYVLRGGIAEVDAANMRETLAYLDQHGIRYLILEIHSPGGSLFHGQRLASLLLDWQKDGKIVETRVYGFGASAAFQIFVAGTIGYRFVAPEAELMWHELISFKFFDISSPADKEDEAQVLRHLQDTRNEWLASRSKLTKEELDKMIRKKEFWMNGKQALKYGFADGLLFKPVTAHKEAGK